MSLLTDRASLLREFFRLVNADANDGDLTEHDDSTLEGAYEALQVGVDQAQDFLISIGQGDRWLTTTSTLSITGSDPDRYAALPSDFLMLDSNPDQQRRAVRVGTVYWGSEISPDDRNRVYGNYYYVRGLDSDGESQGLYVTRGAAFPTGAVADYFSRHATLADSTTVEFPASDRPLIPAYAAVHASYQSWFPGGIEEISLLRENLRNQQQASYKRGRRTRRARKVPTSPVRGHWMI